MTVIIEKPAINLREELADLRNQGTYQEQQFWFENAVTNGAFDSDISGWTDVSTGTGSISWDSSGYLALTSVDSSNRGGASATITGLVIGKPYVIALEQKSAGVCYFNLWPIQGFLVGTGFASTSGANIYSLTVVATATTMYLNLVGSTSSGTVTFDNISVFETDGTDIVHRMPKGWVPKDVFEDGLLQREGAANDYTVVYDGFDYYVKPAVAPSATTQTCVIGVRK